MVNTTHDRFAPADRLEGTLVEAGLAPRWVIEGGDAVLRANGLEVVPLEGGRVEVRATVALDKLPELLTALRPMSAPKVRTSPIASPRSARLRMVELQA
jgi:hypothetical protein